MPVPTPAASSSSSSSTASPSSTPATPFVGTKLATSLSDPAAKAACDARETFTGTFVGTGSLDFCQGAYSIKAKKSIPETKAFDGTYSTTISLSLQSFESKWTDDVHGQSLSANYWSAYISTVPYAAPRTDTFVVGKPESVVLGFGIGMQFVCTEDGSWFGGGGGDDDDAPPPATSLTLTERTPTRLAGTVTRGADTFTFEVAFSDDDVPTVCCL